MNIVDIVKAQTSNICPVLNDTISAMMTNCGNQRIANISRNIK